MYTCFMSGQLNLDLMARTWGGKRAGAGRPRGEKQHDSPHVKRPKHVARHPLHVVWRTVAGAPNLRTPTCYAAIRDALAKHREDVRIVHVSIQANHLHLLVEARDAVALTTGLRSVGVLLAREINRASARTGKLFAYRYHATAITSPRQMFNTLAYVLNNWRKHREDRGSTAYLDRYSSAIAFDGWEVAFATPIGYEPLPVQGATTWLLRVGWRRHGTIHSHHCPTVIGVSRPTACRRRT